MGSGAPESALRLETAFKRFTSALKETALGNLLFYAAYAPGVGFDLFRSDGTAPGTFSVDVVPGPSDTSPLRLIAVGDQAVFFQADVPGFGVTLWRSDGTVDGTVRIVGPNGGLRRATPVGERLLFMRCDPCEPWVASTRSDVGVPVTALADLLRGADVREFEVVGDLVYFAAAGDAAGEELWAMPVAALAYCGDGIVDAERGETCDDGNLDPNDACDCAVVPEPSHAASGCVACGLLLALRRQRRRIASTSSVFDISAEPAMSRRRAIS